MLQCQQIFEHIDWGFAQTLPVRFGIDDAVREERSKIPKSVFHKFPMKGNTGKRHHTLYGAPNKQNVFLKNHLKVFHREKNLRQT